MLTFSEKQNVAHLLILSIKVLKMKPIQKKIE